MSRSLVAPLSGAAQCDIVIAIYRISLSFAGNELGNDPTARKQLRWRRRLDLICTSGQRRTNTLVARTYARWPLRASGGLGPLARTGPPSKKSRRASGPAVNVEAWAIVKQILSWSMEPISVICNKSIFPVPLIICALTMFDYLHAHPMNVVDLSIFIYWIIN